MSGMRSAAATPADIQGVKDAMAKYDRELTGIVEGLSEDQRSDLNIVREGGPVAVKIELENRLKDGDKAGAHRLYGMSELNTAITMFDDDKRLVNMKEQQVLQLEALRVIKDPPPQPAAAPAPKL
jgi:hypothetical protein